ncbi:hypothetical protein RDWZM_009603 [Blomia tropicalis]|uniref:Transcription initiation factor TFIID subunit 2 n=1 Tax=Blomia tropicalis TaxID=40697 RepID=A0A9Q0M375_BLOTA|nr:hypothetical protein RDWZM_009603 [Blomia tropicalis]
MSKREYSIETHRNFKISHQLLCITNIDFQSKKLVGFTELQVVSQIGADLTVIRLNCQQCQILSIYINEYMCDYTYSDPSQDILNSSDKKGSRKLDTFSTVHYEVIKSTDSDFGNGELIIRIPDRFDIKTALLENKSISVYIAYMIENPTGGIYFAVNNQSNQTHENDEKFPLMEDDFQPHMFSYGRSNSSRLWFPCVDSFSESCTWSIIITVDDIFTAICSGELSDVEHNVEKKKKRYIYTLNVPTSAPNIGIVVGPFVAVVHPHMHEVVNFCFPSFKQLLLDTCAYTHRIFMHYEEMLNTRYPYATYKQVFVDNMISKYEPYSTLSILSINLLHSKHVIEQAYVTRRILAQAIAEQYFGCFISMQSTTDAWLTRGISGYLASDYFKKAFGNNEYRYYVKHAMDKVIKYEQQFRPIVLDPSWKSYVEKDYFYVKNFHTFSPSYDKLHRTKSFLIMRMLEIYLGRPLLLQVFNKMLSLAQIAAPQKFSSGSWYNLHASTSSFIWAISTVTGKNIDTFLKQWVFQGGHVKLTGSFVFNRKRNTVELEIKQLHNKETGVKRYLGPISIWLQELDGTFKHMLQIEDNTSNHDLTCHSKSRRNKKKKIPLCTGEEIDMDLSGMDQDSPVLWLRIDPEMTLLREVLLSQPDYQWQYQLRHERDVIAQVEALAVLDRFYSNINMKNALIDTINNERVFYRVRCEATFCLRRIANKMGANWIGQPAMLSTFRKLFGSPSCPQIVRMNNFTNFQHYFIQKSMIVAIAGLRTAHGICPQEVSRFLLDLFKYNDNSKNFYTDAYLRAALVDALAETVTPVAIAPMYTNSNSLADMLSQDTKSLLEEISRCFNLDKLLPSYKHVITISCLRSIRHLQKMGHLPSNPAIFRAHTSNNCYTEVRKVAIEILVDIVKAECRKEEFDFLLDLVINDPQPVIKFYTLKYLIRNPPFSYLNDETNVLDTEELVEQLWTLMNSKFPCNSKLRCAVVDFYYVLYGRGRPRSLPKPEFSFVLNIGTKKNDTENDSSTVAFNKPELSQTEPNYMKETTMINEVLNDKQLDIFPNVSEEPVKTMSNIQVNLPLENKPDLLDKNSNTNQTFERIFEPKMEHSTFDDKNIKEPVKNSPVITNEINENVSSTTIAKDKVDDDDEVDSSPDSDIGESNNKLILEQRNSASPKDSPTPGQSHLSIPTLCIKKSVEGIGSTIRIHSPDKKKKKHKDKEKTKGDDVKQRDKHHKEKKKKKKNKNKQKHQKKHKHHSTDVD